MKRIITILAALTVAYTFSCVAAYAFQNEPDGFGGITWGTNITEVEEELVYLHTDPRYGGIQIYKIKRSWLQALRGYKVWGVRVKNIEYGFWRGQFSEVTIKTKGRANFTRLKDLCFERFGQRHQEGNRERYTWIGDITVMRLAYREFSKEGTLSLASAKIRQLQETFAEQMATGVTWAKTYGGTGSETIPSIELTSDGGCIVAGVTDSFGAGGDDVWVVKLDAGGCIEWEKTYGDTDLDVPRSIQQTKDGGYIVAGYSSSFGADGGDVWVLKLDASGEVEWQKTYGGDSMDYARSIQQTEDDGYIVSGFTLSFGAGQRDLWVLKLDENGNIQWEKTYGVSDYYEGANSIQQTIDGGYIVSGTYAGIWTFIEPISTYMSIGDFWVLKLDENGNIQWQKTYGGTATDREQPTIQQTLDEGYIVAGRTDSFGPSQGDLWVLKLDENGTIQWQKSYGDTGGEGATSIQQTEDTGYIVAGSTDSFGGDRGDMWVLKLDMNGTIQWQKTYGDIGADGARSIQQTTDYGYIVTGLTSSYGAGGSDFWVLKLDAGGNISDTCPPNIGQDTSVIPVNTTVVPEDTQAIVTNTSCTVNSTSLTPQDSSAIVETQCIDMTWAKTYGGVGDDIARFIHQTEDGGYIVTGITDSFRGGSTDIWVLKLDGSGCIQWQKIYGGTGNEGPRFIEQTEEGGYIIAGTTDSFRAGNPDLWVLKLDETGGIQWEKTYGGAELDVAQSIQQTEDGGYIVTGTYDYDVWVLKLDGGGDIQWQKTYSTGNSVHSIQQTEDGGYIVAGHAYSSFGAGEHDLWILKLDETGGIQWEKTYGGTSSDAVEGVDSILQTADSGYIVAGGTKSFGGGLIDVWVLKLDSAGDIQWQKTYGGTSNEGARSIQQTRDGGYIVAGYSDSFGAGSYDFWVLKLDSAGDIQWQKTYGDTSNETPRSIQQTGNGGYIIAGTTDSFGAGNADFWLLKLDAVGNISDSCPPGIGQDTSVIPANTSVVPEDTQATVSNTSCTVTSTSVTAQDTNAIVETQCIDMTWAKTYGSSGGYWDIALSIHQTQDGGYFVTGEGRGDFLVLKLDGSGCIVWQKTYGGDVAFSNQQTDDGGYIVAGNTEFFRNGSIDFDCLVLKLDGSGDIEWQKTYGGLGRNEHGRSIQQTQDGGYIVAGETWSFGAGSSDFWVLKLGVNGDIIWQKTYGGTDSDVAHSIQQTQDGGYIVAGATWSFGVGSYDSWVLKLDGVGNIQWQKTYGGPNVEYAFSIIENTTDGGYTVAGVTHSFGAGIGDMWVLKLDDDGDVVWQKTYGGPGGELAFSIQQTEEDGYVVAGLSESFGVGIHDIWVLKLDENGDIAWQKTYGGTDSDDARSIQQTQDGGYVVAGGTRSFGEGNIDFWILKLDAEGNISDTCPSGIGQETSIVPANTSVVPANSQATVSNTSCTVTSPSVTPQDFNAIVETQCENQ